MNRKQNEFLCTMFRAFLYFPSIKVSVYLWIFGFVLRFPSIPLFQKTLHNSLVLSAILLKHSLSSSFPTRPFAFGFFLPQSLSHRVLFSLPAPIYLLFLTHTGWTSGIDQTGMSQRQKSFNRLSRRACSTAEGFSLSSSLEQSCTHSLFEMPHVQQHPRYGAIDSKFLKLYEHIDRRTPSFPSIPYDQFSQIEEIPKARTELLEV